MWYESGLRRPWQKFSKIVVLGRPRPRPRPHPPVPVLDVLVLRRPMKIKNSPSSDVLIPVLFLVLEVLVLRTPGMNHTVWFMPLESIHAFLRKYRILSFFWCLLIPDNFIPKLPFTSSVKIHRFKLTLPQDGFPVWDGTRKQRILYFLIETQSLRLKHWDSKSRAW